MKSRFIKRIALILILLSITFITACDGDFNYTPRPLPPREEENNSGEVKPEEVDLKAFVLEFVKEYQSFNTFVSKSKGATTAKKGIINYNQIIDGAFYKNNDESYEISNSSSTFVTVNHYSYETKDQVAFKTKKDGEVEVLSLQDYLKVYGIRSNSTDLNGYIVNDETILDILKEENNYYIFLDPTLSTKKVGIQMQEFGGLKSLPLFEELVITLIFDENKLFTKMVIDATYNINVAVLGQMLCNMHLEVEFDLINQDITSVYPALEIEEFANKIE